jgi:hypothetical protein
VPRHRQVRAWLARLIHAGGAATTATGVDADVAERDDPVIRTILLHFWLAYDHPFGDGKGCF